MAKFRVLPQGGKRIDPVSVGRDLLFISHADGVRFETLKALSYFLDRDITEMDIHLKEIRVLVDAMGKLARGYRDGIK